MLIWTKFLVGSDSMISRYNNIYCDESCHLQYDESNVMVLGAVKCKDSLKKSIFRNIREIKMKHGLSSWFEIKWQKYL